MHLRSEVSQHQPAASSVGTVSAPSSPFYTKRKRETSLEKHVCSWPYFPLHSWLLPICNSKHTTWDRQRNLTGRPHYNRTLTSGFAALYHTGVLRIHLKSKSWSSPGWGQESFLPRWRRAWCWSGLEGGVREHWSCVSLGKPSITHEIKRPVCGRWVQGTR